MASLDSLVTTSERVKGSPSRLAKIRALADCLASLPQASPRYPGGLALRLARVKRFRDDKRVEEADTMESVRRIHAAQG